MKKITFAIIPYMLVQAVFGLYAQTVYIGGSIKDNNWSARGGEACYWVNGEQYGINGVSVDALTVYDGRVYTAGKYKEDTCRYWIDGTPYELHGCKRVMNIHVDNGNVYVIGEDENGETGYWVNGVRHSGPSNGKIRQIAVVNGVVYAAGYYTTGNWPNDTYYACYWINGVRQQLTNSVNFAATTGIEVVNNRVYVGAIELVSRNNFRACYWINGVQHIIPNPEDLPIDAFEVSSGNVYMMGTRNYYVNGVSHSYDMEGYYPNSSVFRYTVAGGKVYVAGGRFEPRIKRNTSGYWAEGDFNALYGNGNGTYYASIETIFVAE